MRHTLFAHSSSGYPAITRNLRQVKLSQSAPAAIGKKRKESTIPSTSTTETPAGAKLSSDRHSFTRKALYILLLLFIIVPFAQAGPCPSTAQYLQQVMDAQGAPLTTLANLGITTCYFISASGSDANTGSDEDHPWAHLPGSPLCTSACASTAPVAGTGFIFRGGDTWGAANFTINWVWSGTASNPIYIGVDKAWFSGGSWARPIWNAEQNNAASYMFNTGNAWIVLDNFEITGQYMCQGCDFHTISIAAANITAENFYVHGWSHAEGVTGATLGTTFWTATCGGNTAGTTVRYNVIDGSDTTKDQMTSIVFCTPNAYGNYMHFVVTGINGVGDNWHDNVIDDIRIPATGPAHQDGIFHYGPAYSQAPLIYNNIVRNATSSPSLGGAVKFWLSGNNCNTAVGYAFNNIIYNNIPPNVFDTGGHFACSYGTWNIFNNTIDCGMDTSPGSCGVGDSGNKGGTMVLHSINNHWISVSSTSLFCNHFTCDERSSMFQKVGAAKKRGYTSRSEYAFQPSSSNGSTVGKGTDQSALCTAVDAIDSNAGAACKNGTTYACAYNSTNHTVSCPAITSVKRPTGAWDVGAYQFDWPQSQRNDSQSH